jgi:hypothetical protein
VGKTLQIDGGDEEIQSTGPQSLSPLKLSAGGIEGDGDPTFNDLAPPAAVQRARKNHQANADTIQPKEPLPPVANSGGSRRLQVMVAIASLVLGAGLGMLFIGLVFLIVVIGQTL